MEGWVRWVTWPAQRTCDLACLDERAGPAVGEEQRGRVPRRGLGVCVVQDQVAIAWYVDLDEVVIEDGVEVFLRAVSKHGASNWHRYWDIGLTSCLA